MNPIDLLPITRPLEDTNEPDNFYFYDNVTSKFIPDVIKIMYNGIPINLTKVDKLETTLSTVLDDVAIKLQHNPLIQQWISYNAHKELAATSSIITSKKKSAEDYYTEFNIKNKLHRSYVVNNYLKSIDREDMLLEEWTLKDLKKLNQIIASNFINNLVNGKIEPFMQEFINKTMHEIAQIKADIYNKNKIDAKLETIKDSLSSKEFNPSSPKQKAEFFTFMGIESETQTATGSPKWDRAELEKLQQQINEVLNND